VFDLFGTREIKGLEKYRHWNRISMKLSIPTNKSQWAQNTVQYEINIEKKFWR